MTSTVKSNKKATSACRNQLENRNNMTSNNVDRRHTRLAKVGMAYPESPVITLTVFQVDPSQAESFFHKEMVRVMNLSVEEPGCKSGLCLKRYHPKNGDPFEDSHSFDGRPLYEEDEMKEWGGTQESENNEKGKNSILFEDSKMQERENTQKYSFFLVAGVFDKVKYIQQIMNQSYNAKFVESILWKKTIEHFFIMKMWHRCNRVYCWNGSDSKLNDYTANQSKRPHQNFFVPLPTSSSNVHMNENERGEDAEERQELYYQESHYLKNFFVMRTYYIGAKGSRQLLIDVLCHLATDLLQGRISLANNREVREFDTFSTDEGKYHCFDGRGHSPTGNVQTRAKDSDSANKEIDKNNGYNGCITYEVLVSNDHARRNEVVEWSSWTSKKAFIESEKCSRVHHAAQVARQVCIQPSPEVTFWERSDP